MYNFKMLQAFNEHANIDYHKLSVTKAEGFLNVYLNKKPSIINALDDDRLDLVYLVQLSYPC